MEKIESTKEGAQKYSLKSTEINRHPELKTDFPLSEKDEVKKAEEKMRRVRKLLL